MYILSRINYLLRHFLLLLRFLHIRFLFLLFFHLLSRFFFVVFCFFALRLLLSQFLSFLGFYGNLNFYWCLGSGYLHNLHRKVIDFFYVYIVILKVFRLVLVLVHKVLQHFLYFLLLQLDFQDVFNSSQHAQELYKNSTRSAHESFSDSGVSVAELDLHHGRLALSFFDYFLLNLLLQLVFVHFPSKLHSVFISFGFARHFILLRLYHILSELFFVLIFFEDRPLVLLQADVLLPILHVLDDHGARAYQISEYFLSLVKKSGQKLVFQSSLQRVFEEAGFL